MTDLDELEKLAKAAREDWDGPVWQEFWDRLSEGDVITLIDRVREAEAERDAALAAIERVRAEASSVLMAENDPPNDWNVALDYLAKRVLAALDGAPEPEWEVQYGRRNRETGALHWLKGDPFDSWWHENQDRYEHVKRYTSPPFPVEGEKK